MTVEHPSEGAFLRRFENRPSGGFERGERRSYLGAAGDIVREGDAAHARGVARLPEILIELLGVEEAEQEARCDLEEDDLPGHIECGLPAETVAVEVARRVEVGCREGEEMKLLIHSSMISGNAARRNGRQEHQGGPTLRVPIAESVW